MTHAAADLREQLLAAKARLAQGNLTPDELDTLVATAAAGNAGDAQSPPSKARQRLLYLHAVAPSIRSKVVASTIHEPTVGSVAQIDPLVTDMAYDTVHDAIVDGWRVIHFPLQTAPFEDREIDVIGHEFVLEKIEMPHA